MGKKRSRRGLSAALAAAVVGLGGTAVGAVAPGAGDLDRTFGNAGLVMTSVQPKGGIAAAVAVHRGGKIDAVGTQLDVKGITSTGGGFAVAQYLPDGAPDPSFSTDGVQTVDVGSHPVSATGSLGLGVAALPDGSVLAAGCRRCFQGHAKAVVVKLTPAGELDPSFGTNGKAVVPYGFQADADAVAVADDGSIFVAGDTIGRHSDYLVAKLKPDGNVDPSFAHGGVTTVDFNGGFDGGRAIAVQENGKIDAAGCTQPAKRGGPRASVARFTAAGRLDAAFSSDGKATFEGGCAAAVATLARGRLILAGGTDADFESAPGTRVWKVDKTGHADRSFGHGGRATVRGVGAATGVALDGSRIVVPGAKRFSVSRLTANGRLDRSFSGDGTARAPFRQASSAAAVAVQPGRGIVAAGTTRASGLYTLALARFKSR